MLFIYLVDVLIGTVESVERTDDNREETGEIIVEKPAKRLLKTCSEVTRFMHNAFWDGAVVG